MLRLGKLSLVFAFLGGVVACAAESTPNGEPSESDGGAADGAGGNGGDGASPASGGSAGSSSHSGGAGASNGKGGGNDAGGSGGSGGIGVGGTVAGDAGRGGNAVAGEAASAGEPTSAGEGGSGGSSSAGEGSGVGGASAGSAGSGGEVSSTPPCDIYAAAGVPCVGAYSMVRVLSSTYRGPLYQVRRGGPIPNFNEGGETQDIGATEYGFGHAAAQDAFCGDETCTVSVLYDQSGKGNDLRSGVLSCYQSSNPPKAYEADAKRLALNVGGHAVYALYTQKSEGYRNNEAVETPEGAGEQGIYMVADATRAGDACCWDFGTGSRDSCYGGLGSSNALFLGIGYWGSGQGEGPWFMADWGAGVWAGGAERSDWVNRDNVSMSSPYAFGILKTGPDNYALRMGDARSGDLTTAWDGSLPLATWSTEGGIILGMGSDVSASSQGIFYEGVITAGRPSDETDEAVHRSVQAVGYGR
jgi:non-reducing end alpha-L-arabinofuranosidase